MYAKAPYTAISRAVHIHPTVTELVPTVLQSLKPLGAEEPVRTHRSEAPVPETMHREARGERDRFTGSYQRIVGTKGS